MELARVTRQPATLHENLQESDVRWDRENGGSGRWVCKIEKCEQSFARKGGLVNHRVAAHGLTAYQGNILDQRIKKKGKIEVVQMITNQSSKGRGGESNFSSAAFVEDLKAKSASFIRQHSDYEDCRPDELQNAFYFASANGYLEDSPALGLELVSLMLSKEVQQRSNDAVGSSLPEGIRNATTALHRWNLREGGLLFFQDEENLESEAFLEPSPQIADSVASDVSTEDKKHMQIVRATKEKNEEKEKEIEDEIEQKKNKKKKGKQKQQKKVVKQEEEKTLGPINISNQA